MTDLLPCDRCRQPPEMGNNHTHSGQVWLYAVLCRCTGEIRGAVGPNLATAATLWNLRGRY